MIKKRIVTAGDRVYMNFFDMEEYTGLWMSSRKKLHDLGLDFTLLNA